ncbi:MAG: hypothetical protein OHK0045_04300 [Raineya sp.]
MSFFAVSAQKKNDKKKPKGSLEDISETYNVDVLKLNLTLSFVDAETQDSVKAAIQLKSQTDQNTILNQEASKVLVELLRKRIYTLKVSAQGFQDTLLILDLNQELSPTQTILLTPKKVDFEINISDMETGENLGFGVTLVNKNRNEVINLDPKDGNNGKYKVRLREDDEYEVEVKNPKEYLFYANTIKEKKSGKLEAKMANLAVGAKIQLYNITFATARWDLNDNSRRELDRITKLLNDYPSLRVEIAGHTDNKGSPKKNMELSQKRAKSVYQYLIAKKISKKRFLSKGYGQEKPIADNSTEEGRAKNRRFELIVLGL